MTSLHEGGWRQGSIFFADWSTRSVDVFDDKLVLTDQPFELWVVASQDCDLATTSRESDALSIEIRPARTGSPGTGWGIRSRALRLRDDVYVETSDPRLMISARALDSRREQREPEIDESRAIALKTWLGLRYDRPAVPENLVDLARSIAAAVKLTRTPARAAAVHDVLFQARSGSPATYWLTAVLADTSAASDVQSWMSEAALKVPVDVGILGAEPLVLTKAELSLEFLESSWAADLSELSWVKSGIRGAT